MRILDRERYWAFLKAYVICFVALVGLYVVIDAFSNLDEFLERSSGLAVFAVMGRFYLVRMSLFYDRLCGIISMMAAIFTVTWMQKNNELLAMLAAGIGTKRVIRPVLIAAVLVSGLAVANQEWLLPQLAEEAQKPPDDDGKRTVPVYSRYDRNNILIYGQKGGDRATRTISKFSATLPVSLIGSLGAIEAEQAQYIPEGATRPPQSGGWLLRGAVLTPPDAMVAGNLLIHLKPEEVAKFPPPPEGTREIGGESYFLRSNVTFAAITRDRQWFRFAPTLDLIDALTDTANAPDKTEIAVFLHSRILRPLLGLALLCTSLPLVLGGDGRNMFINLGLSLGTSGLFYGICFFAQYLGSNAVLSAELAAWAPLIGFGTLAASRWDRIRT